MYLQRMYVQPPSGSFLQTEEIREGVLHCRGMSMIVMIAVLKLIVSSRLNFRKKRFTPHQATETMLIDTSTMLGNTQPVHP